MISKENIKILRKVSAPGYSTNGELLMFVWRWFGEEDWVLVIKEIEAELPHAELQRLATAGQETLDQIPDWDPGYYLGQVPTPDCYVPRDVLVRLSRLGTQPKEGAG